MRSLLLPCLAFVLLRAALLVTHFDATCVPNYELAPMGQIAWTVAHGAGPKGVAAYYDNCGGHLLVGMAAGPLMRWIGERYLALKLVSLAAGLLTLVGTRQALARQVGPRAATGFAWAFALGTPALFQASCLAMGNHVEGLSVQALVLLAGWAALREPRPVRTLGLGLAAGLAVFVYFGSAPLVAALVGCTLLRLARARGTGAERAGAVATLALGLLLGASPLWVVHGASDGRPVEFLSHALGGDALGRVTGGGARALLERALTATSSPGLFGIPGPWLDGLAVGLAVLVWGSLAWAFLRGRERNTAGPLLLALGLSLVLLAALRLPQHALAEPMQVVGRRYWLGLQYLTLVAGAVLIGRRVEERAAPLERALALPVTVAFLLLAASGWTWIRLRPDETGQALTYDGVHGPYWGAAVLDGALDDPEEVRRRIASLPAGVLPEVLRGTGHLLAWQRLSGADPMHFGRDVDALVQPWPAEWRRELLRGVGTYLRASVPHHGPVPSAVRARLAALEGEAAELATALVEGAGLEHEYPLVRLLDGQLARTETLAPCVPVHLREALWHGHGERCGELERRGLTSDLARVRAQAARVPAEHAQAFAAGRARTRELGLHGAVLAAEPHPGGPGATDSGTGEDGR